MPGSSLTILAVDDDMEDLELIEDAISDIEPSANFKKLTDGSRVLPFLDNLLDSELPCLIILDYNMPETNGAQVINELCNIPRYQTIPKVVLSTSNATTHKEECIKKGAANYFVKPSNLKDLNRLTKEMLSYCNSSNNYDSVGI